MRKRFGSGIYAGHSLLNMATKTFITWVHDLKQISLYKLIKKGCKTVSSPGNAEREMWSTLKALLKPCFHPNIKFMALPKSYSTLGMTYLNSIKVTYCLMRKSTLQFLYLA